MEGIMALYLLPESVARQDGAGAAIALDEVRGKELLLTLGITRTIQQESLEISIWGSPDRERWRLLETFPKKFYCGTYSMVLNLKRHADVRHLRVQWKMHRWGGIETVPLFGFHVRMEETKLQAVGA
jgi:hypothetical protein